MKVKIPTVDQVIATNKYICEEQGNPFNLLDHGKIESAIHTAFYPGSYPFSAGGIAKIAGALCFYLVQAHAFMDGNKRTGALVVITFMNINGWDLNYPEEEENGKSALANIIEKCAASRLKKEDLIDWFDLHKTDDF
ncbi:type II toxin-antitoxin system death-on-curing family toxin [Bacteriovoracaceae bacterium]|nr:type II toxin-antitoxin system death-on-curing family toxin [Bacteriovoracaceae bacterium]